MELSDDCGSVAGRGQRVWGDWSLRVLHVLTSPNRRGAEWGAFALSRVLCERGVDSDIVALAGGRGGPELAIDVLGKRSLGPSTLLRLRRRCAGVDVVVAHGSRTLPASALALAATGVPFVYKNIGDTAHWSHTPLRRVRVRAALRRAAAVVALTDTANASLRRLHRLPQHQVVTIPSWRSGTRFTPATPDGRRAARLRFGVPVGAVSFLVLGALAPEKRLDLAIDAVAALDDGFLLLVGEGPELGRLEELAAERLPGRHAFAGAVDEPQVALHAADVLLLTSESEGVPGVLIEAGLSCIPVVTFDVGGAASVVVHGETGFVVPQGDVAAMTVAAQRAVAGAATLGQRARQVCLSRYDIEQVVEVWLDLLTRTAGRQAVGERAGR